jgi:hypothetical protein
MLSGRKAGAGGSDFEFWMMNFEWQVEFCAAAAHEFLVFRDSVFRRRNDVATTA